MSGYQGRTGPNFSDFLNNLNTVSPPGYQFGAVEEPDFNQDLAMFTNTDFTNIDAPLISDDGTFNFDLPTEVQTQEDVKFEEMLAAAGPTQHFDNPTTLETASPQNAQFFPNYNTPIQPAPSQGFGTGDSVPVNGHSGSFAHGRQSTPASHPEEQSRFAAEEDKRRRNTAASARFRVKKKQREQAMEKTAKEMHDKNSKLEAKISQLEQENQWLKSLITEKHGLQSREEVAAAYQKYRKESEERDLSEESDLKNEPEHTTGVGTN